MGDQEPQKSGNNLYKYNGNNTVTRRAKRAMKHRQQFQQKGNREQKRQAALSLKDHNMMRMTAIAVLLVPLKDTEQDSDHDRYTDDA